MTDIVDKFLTSQDKLSEFKNPCDLEDNLRRVSAVLYLSEKLFQVKELTAADISEILLKVYRCSCSQQAIRTASLAKNAKGKLGCSSKDKLLRYYLLAGGIKEIQIIFGSKDISRNSQKVVPQEIVAVQPDYLKKIVYQINGCYDNGFYDACFVMIRRLIETLIIEVYEGKGREAEIKRADGDFMMFGDLVKKVINDSHIKTSRNFKRDLNKIKEFGDTAAHNRMLNLKQPDIDKYSDLVRMACEELINNLQSP
jgi:hypothetical protein